MKKVFIVNPTSGNGKSLEIAKEIKALLDNESEDYQMYYTSSPKEATNIARLFNNSIIYSVGGDGTLFEVINGIANSNNVLGIIPAGTGNDFIKTINNDNEFTSVDLCKMNEHYFINIASVGIDAEIANNQVRMKEIGIPKSLTYKASIVNTLFKFKNPHLKVEINGNKFDQDITILAICNGKYYGGGFKIAPNAIYCDGKFDVYLVDSCKKFKIPGLLLKVIKSTHEESKYVHKYSTDKVRIQSDNNVICNLDGEIFHTNDMEFSITGKKIPIYTADDKIKKLCKSKGLYK